MSFMADIQSKLKAPKGQYNKFGGFSYRSCEDIVEAVKPILAEHELYLNITDEIVLIGERYYVKATATVYGENFAPVSACAFAREPFSKKGMDEAQLTGATSSYARKYALNGLFAIDDNKDADTGLLHGQMDTKEVDMEKVQKAANFFKKKIDEDDIEGNFEVIQHADHKLTNDERSYVAKELNKLGKAPGSRKKYTTILREYMEYQPNPDNFNMEAVL